MRRKRNQPLLYPITAGKAGTSGHEAEDFRDVLASIAACVNARVDFFQIREKHVSARALCQLVKSASNLTRGSFTRLLVNDRSDIALAAGADGVHLTSQSIGVSIIRKAFPAHFIIGVSAHNLDEAKKARDSGADFATLGPIFDTPSKRQYGQPLGLDRLREAARELRGFALIALGGITVRNAASALEAGAAGVSAIRMFSDPGHVSGVVAAIRNSAIVE